MTIEHDSCTTSTTPNPVRETQTASTFQDVFLGEYGLFWNLSVALAILCLHERDPALASFAVVCRHSFERRNDIKRAMQSAVRSVLRLSNPIILGVANSLTLQDYIHLYRQFHRLYPVGVFSNSNALEDADAVERLIPLGFNGAYLDFLIDHFDDDNIQSYSRARNLRRMIENCLNGRGRLNQLIVYGIFASVENREDAVGLIDHMKQGSNDAYHTPRCANLRRLLRESYWISDISDIQPTAVGHYTQMDRVQGLQLTYSPHDLARLTDLSVTDDVDLW
jgi:hypothetical protein